MMRPLTITCCPLVWSMEYYGRLKNKNGELINDELVAGINRKERYEGKDRITKICDWIIRNHNSKTDDAIRLFSNENTETQILLNPYEDYVAKFNEKILELLKLVPTPQSVDKLLDDEDQSAFIRCFRQLMRTMNTLRGFFDFKWADLTLAEQTYEDFKGKYLDLYEEIKSHNDQGKQVSILQEIDFEIDVIWRDIVSVHYIFELLAKILNEEDAPDKREKAKKGILSMLENEVQLRSKRELIDKFIKEYWDELETSSDLKAAFERFWQKERYDHLEMICAEEQLDIEGVEDLIGYCHFYNRSPIGNDIIELIETPPPILQRRARIDTATSRIMKAIDAFEI